MSVEMQLASTLEAVGRVCFNRGLELAKKGDAWGAEEHLCAACALLPTRADPRRVLGKLRAQQGRLEAAAIDLELAQRLAPEDLGTKNALSKAYALLKRRWAVRAGMVGALAALTVALTAFAGWAGRWP
jgi:hypothetical protein